MRSSFVAGAAAPPDMYDSTSVLGAAQAAGAAAIGASTGAGAGAAGLATTGTSVAALCIVATALILVGLALLRRSRRMQPTPEGAAS